MGLEVVEVYILKRNNTVMGTVEVILVRGRGG